VRRLERSSTLAAPPAEVWARAMTEAGINDELRPWLRMRMPRALRGVDLDRVEPGVALGRAWILLAGLLPVDFDDLRLVEVEPGRRFLERSRTLALATWSHERVVEPAGTARCRITDRLGFELRPGVARVPGCAGIASAVVAALFDHRHLRLARRYGRG